MMRARISTHARLATLRAAFFVSVSIVAVAQPASAVDATRLVVLTANVEGHTFLPELREKLYNHNPQIVVVEEALNACDTLQTIAREHGYQLVQARDDGRCTSRSSTAVLVKNGIQIHAKWFMQMTESWTGPQGGDQPPRWYPVVRIRANGYFWRVVGVHFPWVGFKADSPCEFRTGQNLVAWNESWSRVRQYFDGENIRTIAAGDWNAKSCQLDWRVNRMPGDVDLVQTTTLVDHAITKNSNRYEFQRFNAPYGHGWIKYGIWSPTP